MSDDDERLKNLLICKVWATDKEMEEMAPFLLVVIVLILIFIGIASCFGEDKKDKPTDRITKR
jgi:hypothetical protein